MAADDKVVIGLTHDDDDAESVLIAHLLGVEALRAGKEALMWLTKNGVNVATEGFADTVNVPNAPSIAELHAEYIERGGRFPDVDDLPHLAALTCGDVRNAHRFRFACGEPAFVGGDDAIELLAQLINIGIAKHAATIKDAVAIELSHLLRCEHRDRPRSGEQRRRHCSVGGSVAHRAPGSSPS